MFIHTSLVLAHCLKQRTAWNTPPPAKSKMAARRPQNGWWVWKGVYPWVFRASKQLSLNRFFYQSRGFMGNKLFLPWEPKKSHMVKKDEDAYRLKNLSLFTVEFDYYLGQKNKSYGENCYPWFIPMSGEYCETFFFTKCQKKNLKMQFSEPL